MRMWLPATEVCGLRCPWTGKLQNVPGQGWWLAQTVQAAPQGLNWLRAEIGAPA